MGTEITMHFVLLIRLLRLQDHHGTYFFQDGDHTFTSIKTNQSKIILI